MDQKLWHGVAVDLTNCLAKRNVEIETLREDLKKALAANERDRTRLHQVLRGIDEEITGRMWLLRGAVAAMSGTMISIGEEFLVGPVKALQGESLNLCARSRAT